MTIIFYNIKRSLLKEKEDYLTNNYANENTKRPIFRHLNWTLIVLQFFIFRKLFLLFEDGFFSSFFLFCSKKLFSFQKHFLRLLENISSRNEKEQSQRKKVSTKYISFKRGNGKGYFFFICLNRKKLEIKVFGFPLKFNSMFNPKTRRS